MQNHLYLYPNLITIRKARCTQRELAEHLGISQQEISRYERGEIKAPINYIIDLADFCGVSVDAILGRNGGAQQTLSEPEAALIQLYRGLSPANQIKVTERAETLREMQEHPDHRSA